VDDQADIAPQDEFEKTMVIEPTGQMEEQVAIAARAIEEAATGAAAAVATAQRMPPTPAPAPQKAPALPQAKLQVLSGTFAGRELELTKALTTLGSPNIQVAAITRRAEGFYIVHVESGDPAKHPLVNGLDIGAQARRLDDNDVIELAGVKMGFFQS